MSFNKPSTWAWDQKIPTTPFVWTRPVDWPAMVDVAGEVQFLISDIGAKQALRTVFTRPGAENIYIDWGDGVIDTITTNVATWTTHTYAEGTGIPCSRGYTTFKIRVYGDPGTIIDFCGFDGGTTGNVLPWSANLLQTACGVLEAYYGDGTQTVGFSNLFSQANTRTWFNQLEYVKLPSDVSGSTNLNFQNVFYQCTNLAKVVMPTVWGSTDRSFDTCFRDCYNLIEVNLGDAVINSFNDTFRDCHRLTTITFSTDTTKYSSITIFSNTFTNCYNLTNLVNFPTSLPSCTNFAPFNACYSLQSITIPTLPASVTSMNSAFQNCSSLRQVTFMPQSTIVTSATSLFSGCSSLEKIVFPTGFDVVTLASAFLNCYNLNSVVFPSNVPSLNTLTSTFGGCVSLQEITLPTVVAGSIAVGSTFQDCSALETITLPATWNITSLASTFQGCTILTNAVLPTGPQNSLTTLASTFLNCFKLKTATLPSSMTGLSTLANTFQSCALLKSVVFPSTLNAVTTLNMTFSGCTSLTSVTLPTSMSTLNNFTQTFANCNSLRSVTLPSTVGAVTTFSNAFTGCRNLRSITLPTTQMASLGPGGLSNAFRQCSALVTVNNMDKIGSTSTTSGSFIEAVSPFQGIYSLPSITLACRSSRFSAGGIATFFPSKMTSVRLTNTGTGQWAGASPQVDISYTGMSTAAIVTLFNDLAAQGTVTTKTINITSASGAAGLTAADRLILTSRGWTITG